MESLLLKALKHTVFLVMFFKTIEPSSLKFEPSVTSSEGKILACYYRPHRIDDSLVPSDVCTHIIIAFGAVTADGIAPLNSTDVLSYRAIAKLKEKNPKLKIMISLQKGFSSVVSFGTESMLNFSLSAVTFLNEYNFDGLDLDWEFPNILQKLAYSEFIMIMGRVLHWSGKLLSLALPNDIKDFEEGYFAETLNKHADFVTVMTYDFHVYSKHTSHTDFNSPLYSPQGDEPFKSTADLLDYYLIRGVSPSKMLLGFPTYGRTWELTDASVHGVHAPAVGFGAPGPVTNSTGYYLIQDVCYAQTKGGKAVIDKADGAEYMVFGKTWIAFNGMYSATIKTDWLKKKNLAGVGVWTLENDDPFNVCGSDPFPVLRKVRSYL